MAPSQPEALQLRADRLTASQMELGMELGLQKVSTG